MKINIDKKLSLDQSDLTTQKHEYKKHFKKNYIIIVNTLKMRFLDFYVCFCSRKQMYGFPPVTLLMLKNIKA